MAAPEKNQNASKPDNETQSSFLYMRAHPDDKTSWVRAAKKSGQKLTAWATDVLNRAADKILKP